MPSPRRIRAHAARWGHRALPRGANPAARWGHRALPRGANRKREAPVGRGALTPPPANPRSGRQTSQSFDDEAQAVGSSIGHMLAVRTGPPAVIAANAHLHGVDVDGDLALDRKIPLVLRTFQRKLRVWPCVESERRIDRRDADPVAITVRKSQPAASRAVALFARLGVVVGVEPVLRICDPRGPDSAPTARARTNRHGYSRSPA